MAEDARLKLSDSVSNVWDRRTRKRRKLLGNSAAARPRNFTQHAQRQHSRSTRTQPLQTHDPLLGPLEVT